MATSAQVRSWAASQTPPLAKADTRGRLSKTAIKAYNEAHAADPYGDVVHILPVPEKPAEVQDEATHPGTVENPSAVAVEPQHAEPFTEPVSDDDYSNGSNYKLDETSNVRVVDFSAERYTESP